MRSSGPRGAPVLRHRTLVPWENSPREHEHNKNKDNVNLPAYHGTILVPFPQRSPHLPEYSYQLLPLLSLLWNSKFPFTTVNKGKPSDRRFVQFVCSSISSRCESLQTKRRRKRRKASQSAFSLHRETRDVHGLRFIPRICLANTPGRKRILVLETCLVRCTKHTGFQNESIGIFKSDEIFKIHREIKRTISQRPVYTQIQFNTFVIFDSNFLKIKYFRVVVSFLPFPEDICHSVCLLRGNHDRSVLEESL